MLCNPSTYSAFAWQSREVAHGEQTPFIDANRHAVSLPLHYGSSRPSLLSLSLARSSTETSPSNSIIELPVPQLSETRSYAKSLAPSADPAPRYGTQPLPIPPSKRPLSIAPLATPPHLRAIAKQLETLRRSQAAAQAQQDQPTDSDADDDIFAMDLHG